MRRLGRETICHKKVSEYSWSSFILYTPAHSVNSCISYQSSFHHTSVGECTVEWVCHQPVPTHFAKLCMNAAELSVLHFPFPSLLACELHFAWIWDAKSLSAHVVWLEEQFRLPRQPSLQHYVHWHHSHSVRTDRGWCPVADRPKVVDCENYWKKLDRHGEHWPCSRR